MLYPWCRRQDLVKVFGAGPVSKVLLILTYPNFSKLAWMMYLDLHMYLKNMDAETGA